MQHTWLNNLLTQTGRLGGVHVEKISPSESFMDMAARFAPDAGTVVLMSGGNLDCARYHILGIRPWLTVASTGNAVTIQTPQTTVRRQSNPFEVLGDLCTAYRLADKELPHPCAAGLLGYLSYDLKDHLETLPRTSFNDLELPDLLLFAPSLLLIHDKRDQTTHLLAPRFQSPLSETLDSRLDAFKHRLAAPLTSGAGFHGGGVDFKSNFDQTGYVAAVERIKAYITDGHVYQVNLSQRFQMGFYGDSFSLFRTLYAANPAPFFAYVNAGDHQIVSTSPERFLKRSGRRIETRPIKGTRPRGRTAEEDAALKRELVESQKDDAELSMIVDLLRNDMGKVCRAGSVSVTEHKRLEAYQNVYHLVSIVEGTLDERFTTVDLIKATFPGGSITGCPKIRSMEIIDELEPCRRHVYTGAIGYIGFDDTLDLSIAIRTATVVDNQVLFSVGGGIVHDSDPLSEYEETLHKGRTLMEVFEGDSAEPLQPEFVWHNGQLKPLQQATVSIAGLGFQYGFGFFETLRVDAGQPHNLSAHIERFNHTWEALFSTQPPDLSWDLIIKQVVAKCSVQQDLAVVKLMASKGPHDKRPRAVDLCVRARRYASRFKRRKTLGVHLATFPEPRQTPLARHKTMNYLYYHLAGQWAHTRDCDEALILNPDSTVSETNTANLLLIKTRQVVRPHSPAVLPGTMEKLVIDLLKGWNYEIVTRPVRPEELSKGYQVVLTNSLIGVQPVVAVDDRQLTPSTDLCRQLNTAIFPKRQVQTLSRK